MCLQASLEHASVRIMYGLKTLYYLKSVLSLISVNSGYSNAIQCRIIVPMFLKGLHCFFLLFALDFSFTDIYENAIFE